MKTKSVFLSFLFCLISCPFYAQESCLLKAFEKIEKSSFGDEITKAVLEYDAENQLQGIKINDGEQYLKFETVDSGEQITWLWSGKYSGHFILTDTQFIVFEEEGETRPEEAYSIFDLKFEDGKLIEVKSSDNYFFTYEWEGNNLLKYTEISKSTDVVDIKSKIEFESSDTTINPLKQIELLGYIYFDSVNFFPLEIMLSENPFTKGIDTNPKNGETTETVVDYKTEFNENGCLKSIEISRNKELYHFYY